MTQSSEPFGSMPFDAPLTQELLESCLMVGRYSRQLIEEEWPKFRAHRIEEGKRSTVSGFSAAFRDRWLVDAKRFAEAEGSVAATMAEAERRYLAERNRESKRREAIEEEARRMRGPPEPETRARMAELMARLEEEAPSARTVVAACQPAQDWTPPTAEQRAAIQAELDEEMRKAGGLQ